MGIIEGLGAVAKGRQFSIYVPSNDKEGKPIDHRHWMTEAESFLTGLFGRCTTMPKLKGTWVDKSGTTLREATHIVFCYVERDQIARHAQQIRNFLVEMGTAINQAEVGIAYDGEFGTIAI